MIAISGSFFLAGRAIQREPFFSRSVSWQPLSCLPCARYTASVRKKGKTVAPKVRKIERKIFNENGGPALRAYRAATRATRAFLLPRLRRAGTRSANPPSTTRARRISSANTWRNAPIKISMVIRITWKNLKKRSPVTHRHEEWKTQAHGVLDVLLKTC